VALEEENQRLRDVVEENCMLKDQFGTSTSKLDWVQRREEQQKDIIVYQLTEIQSLEKRIKELEEEIAELHAKGAPVSKEKKNAQSLDPSQESDKFSLPFEKAITVEQFDSLNVDEVEDKNKWQVAVRPVICTPTPTFQDASMQMEGDEVIEVEDLKQNLKVAV